MGVLPLPINGIITKPCRKTTPSTQVSNLAKPFFLPPSSTAHINCARVLADDTAYTNNLTANRVVENEEPDLAMDCESIYKRNYYPQEAASEEEQEFPIAFSRVVFKDYRLIEMQLAGSYASQNWFCFSIDIKSDPKFKNKMKRLASCFDNVIVGAKQYNTSSYGHQMTYSQLQCMEMLVDKNKEWKYLVLHQNHDIALKTNQELVQIYKWFAGANDVEMLKIHGQQQYLNNFDLSFEALKLFKNSTRNKIGYKNLPPKLQLAKGFVQSSLSRAMVEFMIQQLDLTKLVEITETGPVSAIDESYLQSISTTDAINAPGSFTHACLDKGIEVFHVSRYSLWNYFSPHVSKCKGGLWRHQLCIFGLEDLNSNLRDSRYLFANKMMPEMDLGAITCWFEALFNRTYMDRGVHRLNSTFYLQLPHVRFNALRSANGSVDTLKFDCKKGNVDGEHEKYPDNLLSDSLNRSEKFNYLFSYYFLALVVVFI